MLNLASTSDKIQVVTGVAATTIEVHTSWVDLNGTTVTPGRTNSRITTAATTDIVPSPSAGTVRNVKGIYINNNSAGTNCPISVVHTDGASAIELMSFVLLPGEFLTFNEEGGWRHRDNQGAEYPSSGMGNYNGKLVPFMKTSTAAKAAGNWYCTSKDAGYPGAWAVGTPGVNGRVTDGTTSADYGCIPITNAVSGSNFLTALDMQASVNHTHDFFDCLWVNSGIAVTTTTAQTIASPTLPARDVNGATSGEGCGIALLFTAASTNGAAISNTTVSYTNSKGVSGRTATLTTATGSAIPASPVIGTMIWFALQAGDTGVQSIQGITLGTSLVTGSVSLMITRDICTIGTTMVNVASAKNIGSPGIKMFNGTCLLHNIMASATTATFMSGSLTVMEK